MTLLAWESTTDTFDDHGGITHMVLPSMARTLCGRAWVRLGPRWGLKRDGASDPTPYPECREAMRRLLAEMFPQRPGPARKAAG